MKYIKLLSSVLALLLMLTVNAYATTIDDIPEDVPDWALKPALEPGEEPEDTSDTDTTEDSGSEQGYTTIYNADGTIRYTNDPALLAGESAVTLPYTASQDDLFLTKPFDEYTVTEGMLLLFLVLGFCLLLWKIVKGVF